jgi:C4-dicarboxylate transporter DctM subunit
MEVELVMEPLTVGILGVVALLVLLGLGVHIGIAMMAVGLTGLWAIDMPGILSHAGGALFYSTWKYEYAVMPLFILMSAFAAKAGVAQMAYNALYKWFYKLPGSLAIATTFGSAVFGAVSGSSMATSAVFGKIAIPTMSEYGYDKRLSLGSIAASGTFACMIPPSTLFVLYGILTETSIGRLFLSGVIPGLITAVCYAASIVIRCKKNSKLAPSPADLSFTFKEKVESLKDGVPILGIIVVVLGGIYGGYFTVTEGAAIGCVITLVMGLVRVGAKEFDLRAACRKQPIPLPLFSLLLLELTFLPGS